MIILDTNVLSETMRPDPSPSVMTWLAAQDPEALYTTAVTAAEIRYGIAALPRGRKRAAYEEAADGIFGQDFIGRVLPFDLESAGHYARIVARPGASKDDASLFDAMISSIAIRRGSPVATRNIRHFRPMGVTVINPWDHPAP